MIPDTNFKITYFAVKHGKYITIKWLRNYYETNDVSLDQ